MPDESELLTGGVEPHLAHHGKVAYVAIPARDPITSAVFYEAVFGWTLDPPDDKRVVWELEPWDNTQVPFSDVANGIVGVFTGTRGASSDGVLLGIYVNDIEGTLREIESRGCEVVEPVHLEGAIRIARFRDPGGNIVGIWERA